MMTITCVYIRVPPEKVAPIDTGLTETVQHHDSHRAGLHNTAPVLHSSGADAGTRIAAVAWRFQDYFVRACLGLAA